MATQVTKRAGGLLLRRFTFTAEAEVYFLLHYPLGFPSHPLDGTLSYRSSDFPLLAERPHATPERNYSFFGLNFVASQGSFVPDKKIVVLNLHELARRNFIFRLKTTVLNLSKD